MSWVKSTGGMLKNTVIARDKTKKKEMRKRCSVLRVSPPRRVSHCDATMIASLDIIARA